MSLAFPTLYPTGKSLMLHPCNCIKGMVNLHVNVYTVKCENSVSYACHLFNHLTYRCCRLYSSTLETGHHFKHLMLYADGRFAKHPRFRFFALNTEMRLEGSASGKNICETTPTGRSIVSWRSKSHDWFPGKCFLQSSFTLCHQFTGNQSVLV